MRVEQMEELLAQLPADLEICIDGNQISIVEYCRARSCGTRHPEMRTWCLTCHIYHPDRLFLNDKGQHPPMLMLRTWRPMNGGHWFEKPRGFLTHGRWPAPPKRRRR